MKYFEVQIYVIKINTYYTQVELFLRYRNLALNQKSYFSKSIFNLKNDFFQNLFKYKNKIF